MKKALIIGIIIVVIIGGIIAYSSFSNNESQSSEGQSSSQTSGSSSGQIINPCDTVEDNYIAPDFSNLATALETNELVSDLPNSGSIRLRFFHFAESCRFYDTAFYITKNSVEQKDGTADIDVWLPSDYAPKFESEDICTIFQEAQNKGDFGKSSTLSKTKLLWRYKGLLSYRDCLGI